MWWNDYIHIPFKERGRDKKGADCWGLPFIIYKEKLGIELPDYLDLYESTKPKDGPHLKKIIFQEKEDDWVPIENPEDVREYDLVLLLMCGVPMHVAVVTKENFMLHCVEGIGVIHEKFTTPKWQHKVMGFFRYARSTNNLRLASTVQQ